MSSDKNHRTKEARKALRVKASEYAKTLFDYFEAADDAEGAADNKAESEDIAKILFDMADGAGILLSMNGGTEDAGDLVMLGRRSSEAFTVLHTAFYLRDLSLNLVENVKRSLPVDMTDTIDRMFKDSESAIKEVLPVEVPEAGRSN